VVVVGVVEGWLAVVAVVGVVVVVGDVVVVAGET